MGVCAWNRLGVVEGVVFCFSGINIFEGGHLRRGGGSVTFLLDMTFFFEWEDSADEEGSIFALLTLEPSLFLRILLVF